MEEKETIHINGKVIGVIVILLLLVSGTFWIFILQKQAHTSPNTGGNSNTGLTTAPADDKYSNLPEKCRPPAGTDITQWKEHLGHHAETQECLKYFD